MAGKNCSYWHCQRLRPPLQRSPFWIPDLPVASSLFAFPSPNARLHAPSSKATGDESEFVLVNHNVKQLQKITELFSVLMFEAIRKYIHPTRYKQIIETQSCEILPPSKQK